MNHLSLLILRVAVAGAMALSYGLDKLSTFAVKSQTFPSVFGMGSKLSLIIAIFAELFCSMAIVVGFATRLAAIPLVITMGIACFVIHSGRPFAEAEKAYLYFVAFLVLLMNGAGAWSVDGLLNQDGFLRRRRS